MPLLFHINLRTNSIFLKKHMFIIRFWTRTAEKNACWIITKRLRQEKSRIKSCKRSRIGYSKIPLGAKSLKQSTTDCSIRSDCRSMTEVICGFPKWILQSNFARTKRTRYTELLRAATRFYTISWEAAKRLRYVRRRWNFGSTVWRKSLW